ncbi:hypothetical protein FCM35_KLT17570 [Carex littledalei]|uniref:Uncharacterized protein n=1 Tax=Carex littledalei TaxID=544730 RepID=A0A833RF83_9POAL|nr:hypothetical protein FCM35_KLT17570 [Carex littledalei]
MDGDDPYIGFEEFLALEYPINSEGDDLLAIEEEEEEDLLAIEEDLGVGEGQGEEGEDYEEQKNEQSGTKSEEDEAAISDTRKEDLANGKKMREEEERYQ